jgi:hypothetical protein
MGGNRIHSALRSADALRRKNLPTSRSPAFVPHRSCRVRHSEPRGRACIECRGASRRPVYPRRICRTPGSYEPVADQHQLLRAQIARPCLRCAGKHGRGRRSSRSRARWAAHPILGLEMVLLRGRSVGIGRCRPCSACPDWYRPGESARATHRRSHGAAPRLRWAVRADLWPFRS